MSHSNIAQILLRHLQRIEPGAEFTGNLPLITSSTGARYYAKVGSPSEQDQYIGEAESLKAMSIAAPGLCPKIFASGITDGLKDEKNLGRPYFLSEYKELGRLTGAGADTLAKRLAMELHAFKSNSGFGFAVPTFCGNTKQENGWYGTWAECYSELIGGLLLKLKQKRGFNELVVKGDEMRERGIPYLLGSLNIDPVLLHGDLWSGNVGLEKSSSSPIIFDPSSMFGHNEADLAIARIFGGFPASFYSIYHEYFPKSEPVDLYDARADLYEAYHYLNHTVLFGGSYASNAMEKLCKALAVCPQ